MSTFIPRTTHRYCTFCESVQRFTEGKCDVCASPLEALTENANAHRDAAMRYAAERLAEIGMPQHYDQAVDMLAMAWLEGGACQLRYAKNLIENGEGL